MPWQDGGSKLRAVRAAPGRLACEPMDDDYLRELAYHEAGHAVVDDKGQCTNDQPGHAKAGYHLAETNPETRRECDTIGSIQQGPLK